MPSNAKMISRLFVSAVMDSKPMLLDSDGDGVANGVELGNPNCVWTRGISNFDQFDFDHMKTIINRQPALAKLFVTK